MQDFYALGILAKAETDYRRRLAVSLRQTSPIASSPHLHLRSSLAQALAHLALHLDGRSISAVAAHHAPTNHHGRAA